MDMTEKFVDKVDLGYTLNKRELALLKFSYKALFYDLSKILVLFFIALFFDKTAFFVLDMFLLILLRSNHGGIHLKHYWSCFFMSFFILAASIALPDYVVLSKVGILFLLFVCIMINYFIGPVYSKQIKSASKSIFAKSQLSSFLIVFVYLVIQYLLPASDLLASGFWVIMFQTLQLIFAKITRVYTERRKNYDSTITKSPQIV